MYLCLKVEINPNNYMLDLFVKIISFSLHLRRKDFIAAREREILKFLGQRKKNYRPCFRPTGLKKKMLDRAKEERVNGASRCGRNTRVQIERASSFPSLPPPATMRNNEGRSLFGLCLSLLNPESTTQPTLAIHPGYSCQRLTTAASLVFLFHTPSPRRSTVDPPTYHLFSFVFFFILSLL